MCPRRILVVDDSASLRAAMRIALEHAGFEVLEAEHGRAALDAARRQFPDLILLDLMMPVLDGWQTIQVLARDFRTQCIPVVAMTARDDVAPEQLAEAGFCAFLQKPFLVAQLLGSIRNCLAGRPSPRTPESALCVPRNPPRAA